MDYKIEERVHKRENNISANKFGYVIFLPTVIP